MSMSSFIRSTLAHLGASVKETHWLRQRACGLPSYRREYLCRSEKRQESQRQGAVRNGAKCLHPWSRADTRFFRNRSLRILMLRSCQGGALMTSRPRKPALAAGEHRRVKETLTNMWYGKMRHDSYHETELCQGRQAL